MERKRPPLAAVLVLFGILVFMTDGVADASGKGAAGRGPGVVVLDPGHGGSDPGVRGPDGTLEKTAALALARLIQARLSGGPRVTLTRTDDYRLDLFERTALANHLKADLFISLHFGGSFRRQAAGANIFYLKPLSEWSAARNGAASASFEAGESGGVWERIQETHIKDSRRLAGALKRRVDEQTP
ncbi:MAG: N-acetylmuramoyl-L-alanine amidase, partial [Desulfobacterales bacterium]|nr:N-acetylmuramoyl-L-alanine amidase [Desulfobacterales bacterium]